jgi:TRAP-type transport system periplasmic protein
MNDKRRTKMVSTKTLYTALFFMSVLAFGASEAFAQKVTLRVASFLPDRSMAVRGALLPWMESVTKEVGDEVEFKGYWGGSLGRSPEKYFDLVKEGVADVAMMIPGYTPGRFPGFAISELPLLSNSGIEIGQAQWKLFEAGHLKGFEEVKVIGMFGTEPFRIHTRTALKSGDDLKGLKIRTAGPIMSSSLKQLGAVPVGIPLNEATESLSRGVVDGVLIGYSGLGIFKMDSIARYHYEPTLGSSVVAIAINQKTWDSLSPRVKAAMEKYGGIEMARVGGRTIDDEGEMFLSRMKKSGEHHFIEPSKEIQEKGMEAFRPVHDEWIKSNEDGQAKYDAYLKFLSEIRAGK